jgi:hypothetical protein
MGIEPTTSAWEAEVLPLNYTRTIGGGTRIRTGDEGFADLCLTTWLCRQEKRKTGLEPATPTLARWCSTTELLPQLAGLAGFEPAHHGVKVRCLTTWL